MRERRRKSLQKCSIREPMFDDPLLFDTYVEKFPIGMKRIFVFYGLPYSEHINISHLLNPMHIFKIFHLLYGGTYHRKKVTHWFLEEILFFQNLKRNIGQDKKVEERLVLHALSKKVMSHGF